MTGTPLKTANTARLRVEVSGIVQGVGFRPFVYRLARKLKLSGWVKNTSGNVAIEIEGRAEDLRRFVAMLYQEAPPAARIQGIRTVKVSVEGDADFEIMASQPEAGKFQPALSVH
jgi:hydrogenase maturation protein HypF